ncbi:MAG: V-type ATP synthase subunit D [Candidatus Omnitrophica bacterium]|nr:V-type ATP synthase subunit D [Candidatus Omnitrophota bacterium]HOX54087.1 V-type ATP synthase subunit D [Candidatus Omnitrophota bacterium]
MILRVNPNRMELLKLRKRLLLAQRGHKLLQDKLEEMMRRFMLILKDIDQANDDFKSRTASLVKDLLYCRITSSKDDFKEAISKIKTEIKLDIASTRIMNVKVPTFTLEAVSFDKNYDFYRTSGQMDFVVAESADYIKSLLRLAQLLKTLDILSYEIERTRRRVNALEYILIPAITDTIRYITQKLNELERGNLVRLMRVSDIVRSH